MWLTTATQTFLPTTLFLPFSKLPQPPAQPFSNLQLRPKNRHLAVTASSEDVSGLGQAVFSAIKSGPTAEEQPNKGKEISGSDILWAMQRASAKKTNTKKKQKKKGSGDFKRENNGKKVVDFDKIRPLTVKSDWATRLDDLEKRLQEFSSL
ncbi:hypothetical protein BVRB_1g002290 [Beta vulgaris subsp. vulgaris]|nr:hypothetical protein BVRB_1g002290 [Beta vulgaris subsp. vulgaris]